MNTEPPGCLMEVILWGLTIITGLCVVAGIVAMVTSSLWAVPLLTIAALSGGAAAWIYDETEPPPRRGNGWWS